MKILLLAAGASKRFFEVGYNEPKFLIKIFNKTMLEWVLKTLPPYDEIIFCFQKDHIEKYLLNKLIENLVGSKGKIIEVEGLTNGAACTALLAKDLINNEDDLLISNCDQYTEFDKLNFQTLKSSCFYDEDFGGIIFTSNSNHPKWSYVKLDKIGAISEVVEKKVISDIITTGWYYFKSGKLLVQSAESMIKQNIKTNGEFYLAPCYNELIREEYNIWPFNVSRLIGMGTPEDLEVFKREIYK